MSFRNFHRKMTRIIAETHRQSVPEALAGPKSVPAPSLRRSSNYQAIFQ